MAEMIFACPSCARDISCDDAYSNQQIQCPLCGNTLSVPAKPGGSHSALVPKPPAGGSKLNTQINAQQAAKTGDRAIPIRNLAPEKGPKKNVALEAVKVIVLLAALGVGGYYGYGYWKSRNSEEAPPAETAGNTAPAAGGDATAAGDGGQAATGDPNAAAQNGLTNQVATLPIIPPTYTSQLSAVKIPESRVNGKVTGEPFLAETIRVERTATSHVLRFTQGNVASPDREILIYLRLKAGEKLGGQSYKISSDMRGTMVPQVAKRWKTNPRYAPTLKSFSTGYTMKLELGQAGETSVPGTLYLSLPDPEQTVVAGAFQAETAAPAPNPDGSGVVTPVAAPVQPPSGAENDAFRKRYGLPAK